MHEIAPESPFALLSDDETRAWYAYMKVHLRLRYEMNRQLRAEHGLSLADFDVLVALISDEHATLSVSDLAIRIGWERSRVSHHIRRMADRGLVENTVSETDKRVTVVSLTSAGRGTLAAASSSHVELVRTMFLEPLDSRRTRQLAELFEQIYDNLIAHGTLPRPADHP
ncbi:MarR family transcriptional regulator [Frankia canadensis]|uniref:MarR family transcriptional regulator n=1 Tax=Frankia canadensis TaxID=1836972 RepID=A0A2I2KV18_9ACTN|nr:MarR family winged helix-turn-helix transcriptional regulator [Frankia canadensis]SNQ49508.1 MarR family transcriptional regulator [Frankia canadensis]SOU56798.1 MarR family transcriptional regulator [Frankia canadensis]